MKTPAKNQMPNEAEVRRYFQEIHYSVPQYDLETNTTRWSTDPVNLVYPLEEDDAELELLGD